MAMSARRLAHVDEHWLTQDDSGKIYIIGGQAVDDFSDPVTSMLVLDTASGAWSGPHAIPSMPDTTADPTDRFDACAVFADGKIYLVGGYRSDYSGFLDSTLVFDASSGNMSAWTTGPRLKTARGDMACAAVDGAALVVGGWGAPDFRNSAAAERLEDGEWVVKASIPVPRGDATLISLEEGRALLVGGEHHHTGSPGTNLVAEHHVLEYVLAADEWVAKAPIEDGRFRHAAAAVSGWVG